MISHEVLANQLPTAVPRGINHSRSIIVCLRWLKCAWEANRRPQLKKEYECKSVEYTVELQGGQVKLKAKPKARASSRTGRLSFHLYLFKLLKIQLHCRGIVRLLCWIDPLSVAQVSWRARFQFIQLKRL